jgi:O-antigen/teichoic acid export membrane protein
VIQVPVFTTIRTLTNTAGSFTSIINSAVSPDVVKYYSKGEDKKLIMTLITTLFLSGFVINLSLILSLYFIEPLYKIWTNNELTFELNLFLFLAASVSFSNFGMGFVNYFFGANKLKQFTFINVFKVTSLFIVAYVLVSFKELSTVAISVAVSELISSVIVPLYLMKKEMPDLFKGPDKKFLTISLIPPTLLIILSILNLLGIYSLIIVTFFLVIMVFSYQFSWKIIDIEIKKRIKSVIKQYLKFYTRP